MNGLLERLRRQLRWTWTALLSCLAVGLTACGGGAADAPAEGIKTTASATQAGSPERADEIGTAAAPTGDAVANDASASKTYELRNSLGLEQFTLTLTPGAVSVSTPAVPHVFNIADYTKASLGITLPADAFVRGANAVYCRSAASYTLKLRGYGSTGERFVQTLPTATIPLGGGTARLDFKISRPLQGKIDMDLTAECSLARSSDNTSVPARPQDIGHIQTNIVDPNPAPPVITAQPQSTSVLEGQTASFFVAAEGFVLVLYPERSNDGGQTWRRNSDVHADAHSFAIGPTRLADNGLLFRVKVCNYVQAHGKLETCIYSAVATLTVTADPIAPSAMIALLSSTVVAGQSATVNVSAAGSPTPEVRIYQVGAQGDTEVKNCGVTPACNHTTPPLLQRQSGTQFYAVATTPGHLPGEPGYSARTGNVVVTVTPRDPDIAPAIATQPVPASAPKGGSATFTVAATGTAPLAYQWQFNGVALTDRAASATVSGIGGSLTPTLQLANVQAADAGKYRVLVSNAAGTATSQDALLTVVVPPGSAALALLAGDIGSPGNLDGAGAAARFYQPSAAALDAAGNVYIADRTNGAVRKITPAGAVSTLAGSSGVGVPPVFSVPGGIAVDAAGTVYVADTGRQVIRTISPGGIVSLLAGVNGEQGSNDGSAGSARFSSPSGLALDSAGNLYIADAGNCSIRKLTPGGTVSTLAGVSGQCGSIDGPAATALLWGPTAVVVDAAGSVFVADTENHTIRRISVGVVSTIAGSAGERGSADGASALFSSPWGIAIDSNDQVVVADSGNNTLRRIAPNGMVSTIAGAAGAAGSADGPAAAARLSYPAGLAIDALDNLFVADVNNNAVRKLTGTGNMSTFAGRASVPGSADGSGAAARFKTPSLMAVDAAGNAYVADPLNHTLRKITPAGTVSTLAGVAGQPGSSDGDASVARLNNVCGVAVDAAGTVYIAEAANHTVRSITPAGMVRTIAGLAGVPGSADGTGSAARFNNPCGIAVDATGTLFVADGLNSAVRKISAAGVVSRLAGTPGVRGTADGPGSSALFRTPQGVALDAAGNVYVADYFAHTLRKISPAGMVSTLAGAPDQMGSADGTGSAARFASPSGVAADGEGNLYVTEVENNTVRKVTPAGVVTTLVGNFAEEGIRLGASGRLFAPRGVAVAPGRKLAVTTGNAVLVIELP